MKQKRIKNNLIRLINVSSIIFIFIPFLISFITVNVNLLKVVCTTYLFSFITVTILLIFLTYINFNFLKSNILSNILCLIYLLVAIVVTFILPIEWLFQHLFLCKIMMISFIFLLISEFILIKENTR